MIIRQRDHAYAEMFAQGQDYITNMETTAQLEINHFIHEVKKRDSALEQQAALMQAKNQEDEGATYRIEELTRMRDLSEQVAEHINARYQELNNAYQEQRHEAQNALGSMYSSAKDHVDALRSEIQEAQRRGLQEEYAAQHAVKVHAEMSDRYHATVGELHAQLNKMYEERSRAQNSLSVQRYDIAYMEREYEEEIGEHDKRICKHESFAYIAETEESRAVAKMEYFEREMEAMQSEMSVNQRLQIRDRTNDAQLASAMMEVKLLQQDLENTRRHLSEMRDKYNYLECDVAQDWKHRYGRNKVQIRMGMEEFKLREESLRNEIMDTQNEMESQNRSLVVVRHMMDSPEGITEAKIASMAKYEHHVYDEMLEKMGYLALAKNELKVESEQAEKAKNDLLSERSANWREQREIRMECWQELAENKQEKTNMELTFEKTKNELTEMEVKKNKYKDLHAQVEHDYECECQEAAALEEAVARLETTQASEHHQASSSSKAAAVVIAATGTTNSTTNTPAAGSSGDTGGSKVPRRENEKIDVPAWPSLTDLNSWKASIVQQVLISCGDNDITAWKTWLQEAMVPKPDLVALDRTPEARFASIDTKLGYALQKMVSNAGDKGREVYLQLKQEQKLKGSEMEFLKGRVVLAIILNSFRTTSQVEVQCDVSHLQALQFTGDSHLHEFYNKWIEIYSMIRAEDLPSDKFIRDMLFSKLEDKSASLALDLRDYDRLDDCDKSCDMLLEARKKRIRKNQERRLVQTRMTELNKLVAQKALPLASDEEEKKKKKPKAKAEPKAKATPSKEVEKPDPKAKKRATPVYPSPSPKRHAGKPSKPGSSKDRSPSRRDPKKTPCMYHFTKPGGCRNADKCMFSHDQKIYDANKGKRFGSRSPSRGDRDRRARSPTPDGKKRTKTCYKWMEGKCNRANCPFAHEKSSRSASPGRKATPVMADDFFISDTEDNVKQATGCKTKSQKKLRWNMNPRIYRFHCPDYTGDRPTNQTNKGKGPYQRKVEMDEIRTPEWKNQCHMETLIARAKGLLMENGSDNREVRIQINASLIYKVALIDNKDEIAFSERLEKTDAQNNVVSSEVVYISTPILEKDRRFILNSGSGHDLISKRKAARLELKVVDCDPVTFHTANGHTVTENMAELDLGTFENISNAYILDDTPSVVSLGKRCMREGYSFVWPNEQLPFLIDKNGARINLTIHDDIPYINLGSDESIPTVDKRAEIIMKVLAMDSSNLTSGYPTGDFSDVNESNSEDEAKTAKRKKKVNNRNRRKSMNNFKRSAASEGEEVELDLEIDEEPKIGSDKSEEEDDECIEVDVVEGESRRAKKGTLKHEAKTLSHLLTHRYKNPYCDSCVRGKMKHFKTHRGAFKRDLKKFGDLITFDALETAKVLETEGYLLEKRVLIIRDKYTGMIGAFPSRSLDRDDVVRAFKQFVGNRKVRMAYADKATNFDAAFDELKIPLDHSLPGRPQTNSIAERTNQFVIGTTTTCLLEAGLPPCFWRTAIECVCHLLNVEPGDDGLSAWCHMHGKEFQGNMIPYGAKVYFKPSGARGIEQDHKFDPKAIPGIFAGYNLGSGNHWQRQYKVWELADFAKQNFAYDAMKPERSLLKPHITEKVVMVEPIEFPLKGI